MRYVPVLTAERAAANLEANLRRHSCTDEVVPVELSTGEVVAHLCTGCRARVRPHYYPQPPVPDGRPVPPPRVAWWVTVPDEQEQPTPERDPWASWVVPCLALVAGVATTAGAVLGSSFLATVGLGAVAAAYGWVHADRRSTGDLGPG